MPRILSRGAVANLAVFASLGAPRPGRHNLDRNQFRHAGVGTFADFLLLIEKLAHVAACRTATSKVVKLGSRDAATCRSFSPLDRRRRRAPNVITFTGGIVIVPLLGHL